MAMTATTKASRTIVSTHDFRIRAVRVSDGDFRGLIRMAGKRRGYHRTPLTGIMIPFQARRDRLEICSDFRFFYGDQYMLASNYNTLRPRVPHAELRDALDKQGPQTAAGISRYYIVPLDVMRLSKGQQELAHTLVAKAEQQLPEWLGKLSKVEIGEHQAGEVPQRVAQSFKYWPASIRDAALKAGAYYVYTRQSEDKVVDTFDTPLIRELTTPMGGLPQWAKDFMRRGGRN